MNTTWIIGPCSMESRELFFDVGQQLADMMRGRDWYYKASFDKANRSSITGRRGPGLAVGLSIFEEFKAAFPDIPLTTDVHECHQVEPLVPWIDCIQIPAFLCRQTDLLVECGRHFNRVNVKKGQWVSPENIVGAADKVRSVNPGAQVWLSDRGTQLGYDRLVVDFRAVDELAMAFDKVMLDCTHATQYANDGRMGDERQLAERYLLSAPIFGYAGIFAEVHPNPTDAISDADCQIALHRLPALLAQYDAIAAARSHVGPDMLHEGSTCPE